MNLKSLSSGPVLSPSLAAALACAAALALHSLHPATVHAADKPASPAPVTWDRAAAARDQLLVRSLLGDPAIDDDNDPVRLHCRRQPVGN